MFGWLGKIVDKLALGVVRRGQALADAQDRVTEEKRTAVRSVRDALSEAMSAAEDDRDHGRHASKVAGVAAANRARAIVEEIADEEARSLVIDWKTRFDAMPKGLKNPQDGVPGYPEPRWTELKAARDTAFAPLGVVLRELMEPEE
jgi:hypothetical protein